MGLDLEKKEVEEQNKHRKPVKIQLDPFQQRKERIKKLPKEMRIKILTALILSIALGSQFSYGQNHASREMDCSEINSLIVSDALLNVCGEESVALWLDL